MQRMAGLSLIEVLIALAILGVTIGVLAATQASNLRITSDARLEGMAMAEANQRLEAVYECAIRSHDAFEEALTGVGCGTPASFTSGYTGQVTYGVLGSEFAEAGVIRIAVRIDQPTRVTLTRLVSCIDVEPAPSISRPRPCPAPGS